MYPGAQHGYKQDAPPLACARPSSAHVRRQGRSRGQHGSLFFLHFPRCFLRERERERRRARREVHALTGGKGGQGGGLARRQTGSPCLQRSVQGRLLLGESSSLAGSQVSLGGIAAKWWSQKKKTRGRDPGWGRGEVSAAPQRSSAAAVWHSM